jgi:hypothetical protein
MLMPPTVLRGCGTVLQEEDLRKKFLSFLKEKGDIIESMGEVMLRPPICALMIDRDIGLRHPNSEKN